MFSLTPRCSTDVLIFIDPAYMASGETYRRLLTALVWSIIIAIVVTHATNCETIYAFCYGDEDIDVSSFKLGI